MHHRSIGCGRVFVLLSGLRSGSPPKVKRASQNPIMARTPSPPGSIHRIFSYRFASIETLRTAKHLRSGVKILRTHYTLPHFQDS